MSAPVHVQPHEQRCHCCGESIERCRETYRGMSAPVDVLALLDALCERAASGDPSEYREVNSLRDAVTDLIAADSEYDRARAAWLSNPSKHDEFLAARAAWDRRAAALVRVKGGAA
ncbi:hypothetical protein [Stenotrophomonas maltophilia]|uniref:hypothetical protein n=1 Tax=Stenotrophomonas maltophilia TaxID=40324 RepID=UPI0013D9DDFC|nr:hypothetical protein [Stenotrophomonas maltophilia]